MSAGGALRLVFFCLFAALLGGAPARAAPPERAMVRLQLDECLGVDRAKVERLFGIELDVRIQAAGPAAPGAAQVRASCVNGRVELRVDDPLTGKSLERPLNLAAAPERARARLLALALAELLFASWTELEVNLEPPPATSVPAPAKAPVSPTEAGQRGARRLVRERMGGGPQGAGGAEIRLMGAGSLMAYFSGTGALLGGGGGARLSGDHRHHLGWFGDLVVQHGGAASALGALSADTFTTGFGAVVQHRVPLREAVLGLRAGAGLRVGAVRLSGTPEDPALARGDTIWGALVGPLGLLAASVSLPRHLCAELAVEGGYVLTPTGGRVGESRAIAVEGPWVGVHLGLGGHLVPKRSRRATGGE